MLELLDGWGSNSRWKVGPPTTQVSKTTAFVSNSSQAEIKVWKIHDGLLDLNGIIY